MIALNKKYAFTIYISAKQILFITAAVLSLAYLLWEIYWYNKVGLAFIKWHTHLAFPILLFESILLLLLIAEKTAKNSVEWMGGLYLITFNLMLSIFLLELVLVLTPFCKTRPELIHGFYLSPYTVNQQNIYHVWGSNPNFHMLKSEDFSYPRKTNIEGCSDKEWYSNDTSKIRILCIGDSFTEGDGAPADSSYPSILQDILNSKYPDRYQVMNAGVCGSDPFYNFKAYSVLLSKFHPKLILQTISTNDILADYAVRGGLERFQPNNTVKYRNPPQWEPLYAISYLFRLILMPFNLNKAFTPKLESIKNMECDFSHLFNLYTDEANKHHSKLSVCILPIKHEMANGKYDLDMSFLKKNNAVDLFSIYKDSLHINRTNFKEYYWTTDGHHNPKGYNQMAKAMFCVAEKFLEK